MLRPPSQTERRAAPTDTAHPATLLLLLQPPDCDPSKDCGSWVVYPYFLSFVVLVTIIMLQLFTAVIIESFEAQEEQDVSSEQPLDGRVCRSHHTCQPVQRRSSRRACSAVCANAHHVCTTWHVMHPHTNCVCLCAVPAALEAAP